MTGTEQAAEVQVTPAPGGMVIWRRPDGGIVTAPRAVTVEQHLDSCSLRARMRFNPTGRYVATEVVFTALDPDVGIEAKYLRAALNRLAAEALERTASLAKPLTGTDGEPAQDVWFQQVDMPRDEAERTQTPRSGGRQPLSDDFLRDVAREWTQAPPMNRGNAVRNWYRRTTGRQVTIDRVNNWRRKAQQRFPELFEGVSSR